MAGNNSLDEKFPNPSAAAARAVVWWIIGCLVWTVVSVLLAIRQHALAEDAHGVAGFVMYGGFLTGCLTLGLPVGYYVLVSNARRLEKVRQEILGGKTLVRWTYQVEQWRKFREPAIKRENETLRATRMWTGIFIVAPLIAGAIVGVVMPAQKRVDNVAILVACAACIVIFTFILVCYTRFNTRRAQRLLTPQDSYISTFGAHANGRWVLWGTADAELCSIRVIETRPGAPTFMEFVIEGDQATRTERILIPTDQLPMAHKVAEAVESAPGADNKGGGINKASSVIQIFADIARTFT